MSKSNAVTPASFQYINHRFAQKGAFLHLSERELTQMEDAHGMLRAVCGVARFITNIVELSENESTNHDNEFLISTENDDGIYWVLINLKEDIGGLIESFGDIFSHFIDTETACLCLKLSHTQLDLITSLIYFNDLAGSKMTIRSLSFYCSIFQNIHSITDSLYKELAVLLEAAKQVPESEAAEAAS